jgi:hypothetical protein
MPFHPCSASPADAATCNVLLQMFVLPLLILGHGCTHVGHEHGLGGCLVGADLLLLLVLMRIPPPPLRCCSELTSRAIPLGCAEWRAEGSLLRADPRLEGEYKSEVKGERLRRPFQMLCCMIPRTLRVPIHLAMRSRSI